MRVSEREGGRDRGRVKRRREKEKGKERSREFRTRRVWRELEGDTIIIMAFHSRQNLKFMHHGKQDIKTSNALYERVKTSKVLKRLKVQSS